MATKVTSARPIISAAAVEAVRPGLRTEFSRASRPAEPPRRAAGRPTSAAIGFTRRGASMAMPTNSASTPTPSVSATRPPRDAAEQADGDRGERAGDDDHRGVRTRGRASARRRGRRAFTDRRDRRHAGGAQGRDDARHERDDRAGEHADDHRAAREHRAGLRQVHAERGEQRAHALGDPEPEHEPEHGGDEPDDEPFEHDRAHDLAPRGAERAQRRELARALGDGDRERVEDHERAHEQRDAAEAEQEVRDELQALVGVLGVGRGLRVAGLDVGAGRQQRLDLLGQRLRARRRPWP